jgi:GTP cyclohydrolase I
MALMFVHSYLNKQGIEVFDSIKIAKKYCMSMRFVGDALAILGTNVVTKFIPGFRIFGIFKIGRILRLGGIISRLNIREGLKALLNLSKLIFYLCLYMHVLACSWWTVISFHKDDFDDDGRSLQWY